MSVLERPSARARQRVLVQALLVVQELVRARALVLVRALVVLPELVQVRAPAATAGRAAGAVPVLVVLQGLQVCALVEPAGRASDGAAWQKVSAAPSSSSLPGPSSRGRPSP